MKTLKIITAFALFSLSYFYSAAQEELRLNKEPNYSKPKLFADLPQKMNVTISDMESVFDLPVGTVVTAKLAKNFPFKGIIISKAGDTGAQVRSVVIKSTNNTRSGAVLTFSKVRKDDGTYNYTGRILSMESIDAFEIVKENGQYVLQKKNYYEMIRE